MAVGFLDALGHPLLLGHAAAQGDDLLGVLLFGVGQDAQVAEHPLLGVLPDGAGVQNDQIGLTRLVRQSKAALEQHAHELLPVSHVLLAAEGVHTGGGMGLAALKQFPDLCFKVLLAVQLRLGDQYFLAFQISSSKFRYFN